MKKHRATQTQPKTVYPAVTWQTAKIHLPVMRTQEAVRPSTIGVIYSLCWVYFCIWTLKWKQSWISILLPRRRQPIRQKYKHTSLNTPFRSRNRWNVSRLPLLHSFLDTGAHVLLRQRAVVDGLSNSQISCAPHPDLTDPGQENHSGLRAPRDAKAFCQREVHQVERN